MTTASTNRPPFDDPQTFAIIGAALEVHREFGDGFSEPIYREACTFELLRRDIPFAREVALEVHYKGDRLPLAYRADFICCETILVAPKAIPQITAREYGQLRNYLRVARLRRGLLLNLGAPSLEFRRRELPESHARDATNGD